MSEPHGTVVHHPLDPLDADEFRKSAATLRSDKDLDENWRFYQDGNIECEVRATGIMVTTSFEGKQDYDWNTQKSWKVVNDGAKNGLGTPVGYKLVPGGCFPAMLDPSSPVLRRAGVIGHTLWVTPCKEDERWPCGEFVNQSEEDTGLTRWTEQDRSINDTDVVLWYVFGIHHITRPEDWPVMPMDVVSFWLKSVGFFDRNPALDVPPEPNGHCSRQRS